MINDKLTGPPWRPVFLAALAETGNIRGSARKAGISQTTAYDARERHHDFARAWQVAVAGKEYRKRGAPPNAPVPLPLPPASGPATPSKHWRSPFLEALAETSSVAASAARANVAVRAAYKARRTDPEFAAKWLAALHEGYDNLEMEVLGHLRDPAPTRKMDVTAALRLLSAHRETVERRRALNGEEDEQAVLDSIDRFIDEMRERRAANTAILIDTESGHGEE